MVTPSSIQQRSNHTDSTFKLKDMVLNMSPNVASLTFENDLMNTCLGPKYGHMAEQALYGGLGILLFTPRAPYHTNNEFVHVYACAVQWSCPSSIYMDIIHITCYAVL